MHLGTEFSEFPRVFVFLKSQLYGGDVQEKPIYLKILKRQQHGGFT